MPSHNPIRCFEGNAKPHEPFWNWVNKDADAPVIEFYGVISEYSWLGDEVTPRIFKEQLYANGKGGPITMKINSPGGDVIAASVIRSIMSEYPGEITVQVDGVAASAAVIVAITGNSVRMMDSAYMMIHDPAVVVFLAQLDIETLGKLRDDLKTIKDGIVPAYAAKTGLTEIQIAHMMSRETWMSAREAVEYGFADEIIEGGQKTRPTFANVAFVNAFQSYQNVPTALLPSSGEPQESEAGVKRVRDIQRLRERIQTHRKE